MKHALQSGRRKWHCHVGPLLAVFLATLAAFPPFALALERLKVAHSALNLLTTPLWLAKERGFYLRHETPRPYGRGLFIVQARLVQRLLLPATGRSV